MTLTRNIFKMALAAPLALALAACGDDAAGGLDGDVIAPIDAPAGSSWTQTVEVTEQGGYLIGNPDAPLKLVEYGSLTCPACARFAQDGFDPLVEEYVATGRVSFEFRSFIIHGPLDLALTRLIGCSAPESAVPLSDEVWANLGEIQNRAYANQQALAAIDSLPLEEKYVAFGEITGLYDFFKSRGVSEDQARTCLGDVAELERLDELSRGYAGSGIQSTPTFVLNDNVLDDNNWSALEVTLQRAGARPE